jgi:glycosyltransferase involved in cell wall biosynthesis
MPDRALHVALDARCLNSEHLRGTGKSLYELVSRTAASGAIRWDLLADRSDCSIHVPPHDGINVSVIDPPTGRVVGWEQWSLPAATRQLGVDLLHSPATTMPWWQPVPAVVTIQDTARWQRDDPSCPPGFYRDRLLPAAYERASAIMTVSNTVRRDVLARWPSLKPKLHVVSPGVDERYLEAQPDRAAIAIGDRLVCEPYLVYVGGLDPRQRLTWALQTWWSGADKNVSLVVCGVEAASHDTVRRMVPRQFQERLILAPFIDESEMPRLFMRAVAVLYPSLGHGFGLPVIEAQAVGTRVLFSDAGSLGELKGPAAVVLPVDDLQAWVRATDIIVQSRSDSRGPDRIARAWANQYSWDSYVKRTLAVYDSVRAHDFGSHRQQTHQPTTS